MSDIYNNGEYISKNPSWHEEDSPFKAKYIHKMILENNLDFSSIVDVGCGSGTVLGCIRSLLGRSDVRLQGFDVSEEAIALASEKPELAGIDFKSGDFFESSEIFDILMANDVFEHVPDYLGFLEKSKQRAKYKIYHIPLDLHVSAALRDSYIKGRISVGHLHYFSERTALATLADTGHKVLSTKLTPGAIELYRHHPSFRRAVANLPRMLVGAINENMSARLFGGYSLLALTE
jgi:SAM-dependent methyltransferase